TRTYNLSRLAQVEPVIGAIVSDLAAAGVPVEAANTEFSPGQFELNLPAADALTAADRAVMYKHGVREIAAAHGMVAPFMAEADASLFGRSGHSDPSLWDGQGHNHLAPPGAGPVP